IPAVAPGVVIVWVISQEEVHPAARPVGGSPPPAVAVPGVRARVAREPVDAPAVIAEVVVHERRRGPGHQEPRDLLEGEEGITSDDPTRVSPLPRRTAPPAEGAEIQWRGRSDQIEVADARAVPRSPSGGSTVR